ncbi:MAG: carbohydrate porin [Zetaproteobacteria bacterium]|nr:MAG: carbohydrate porin [Zetaproteobacteria bacterium]
MDVNLRRLARFLLLLVAMLETKGAFADVQEPAVSVDVGYQLEAVRNVGGGLRSGSQWHDAALLDVALDTARAGWWRGGTLFFEGVLNHGGDPSARLIGDAQTASNIADGNRADVHQFWYAHRIGVAELLVGLHDLNSVFYVVDSAGLFLNSSFGIGPEISVNVPASLWPRAGGAVVAGYADGAFAGHVGVYDGDPATRAIRPGGEGLMLIAEGGWHAATGALKLGAWRHTGQKTGPDGRGFGSDNGLYVIAERTALARDAMVLTLFLQAGLAQRDRNLIGDYLGFGMHLDAPLPGRARDAFGLAVARAGFTPVARRVNGWTRAETAIEVTYDMAVTDWLHMQPSLQLILHPSGDAAVPAARVGLLRVRVDIP